MDLSTCQFSPPSLEAWTTAVLAHAGCCVLGGLPCAVLLFYSPHRKYLGPPLGVVVALSILLIVRHNDSVPWMVAFLAATFAFSTFFKCIAHEHPPGADADLESWIYWFVMMPEPDFAKGKLRRTTWTNFATLLRCFALKIVGLSMLLSLLRAQLQHRIEAYLHIWLIYLWASFCLDFSQIGCTIATRGIQMQSGFRNPLLESRCLKDLWGERWNLPVHVLLKRAIYKPAMRATQSPIVAVLCTFIVSGGLHEYNFAVHNHAAYQPGLAMTFFVTMGILMIVEDAVWALACPASMQAVLRKTPSIVISIGVTVFVSFLSERWFMRSWLEAGFVEVIAELMPTWECG